MVRLSSVCLSVCLSVTDVPWLTGKSYFLNLGMQISAI